MSPGFAPAAGRHALSPHLFPQLGGEFEGELANLQRAVGFVGPVQLRRREPIARDLLERRHKRRQARLADRQAGGKGVAAEARDQRGIALGHEVERVAQVEALDRPARSFEFASITATMPTTPWCHSSR